VRLLFFGSPGFAVPSLRGLSQAGHEIAGVVTRPDRPRGRGRRPRPTPVKEAARELGLHVYEPPSANAREAVAELEALEAELGVVVAYGEILSRESLAVTGRGFINLHASLLPDYRGAAPINWALIRGEEVTGVSVIRMTPRLDAGAILAQREVSIGPEETAGELHERLAEVGAAAVGEVVARLAAGEPVAGHPQPRETGFFARKLTKEDGRIAWGLGAVDLKNLVRGLTPWPGAFTELASDDSRRKVALLRVEVVEGDEGAAPGVVLRADDAEGVVVRAGEGAVRILELRPAGARAISGMDFIHGYGVRPGDQFT